MKVIAESFWKNSQFASICAYVVLGLEDGRRLRVNIDSGRIVTGNVNVQLWSGSGWMEVHTEYNYERLKCLKNFHKAIKTYGPDETELNRDIFMDDVDMLVDVALSVLRPS